MLWERFPRPTSPRGLELAVSADRGSTFTRIDVPENVGVGRNGSLQGLLMRKLAVSADGALAIVNSSFRRERGEPCLAHPRQGPTLNSVRQGAAFPSAGPLSSTVLPSGSVT